MKRPTVFIYDVLLLPRSQTWVRGQAEALTKFTPIYLGRRKVRDGLTLPPDRTIVVGEARILGLVRQALFVAWGRTLGLGLIREKPALIHAHFGSGGTDVLPLARRFNVPLIVTFHGTDALVTDRQIARTLPGWLFLSRRRKLAAEAGYILAVSHYVRHALLQKGFPPDRTIVHYIGVDTHRFAPMPAIQRENIVLFIGRLIEVKGCEYLIEAMHEVQHLDPEAELVVVGDGPLRSQLQALATTRLRKYRFVGWQSPEQTLSWLQRASLLAVPSVTCSTGQVEALGIVTLEAQATGLPVVGFETGGIAESVIDGRTGFLVPERDVGALANRIQAVLSDGELRDRLSKQARAHVTENFDLRVQTAKLEELYMQAIESA